jgi:hypothetical protein
MDVRRTGPERVELPLRYLRPGSIFLGLGTFLLGSIVLGAALGTSHPPRAYVYSGSILLALGVSLVGGALVVVPSEHWLDPEVEFTGWQRHLVTATSVLCLALAGLAALFGG